MSNLPLKIYYFACFDIHFPSFFSTILLGENRLSKVIFFFFFFFRMKTVSPIGFFRGSRWRKRHGIAARSHELGIGQVNESFPGPLRLIIERTAAVFCSTLGLRPWNPETVIPRISAPLVPRWTETERNKIANLNNSRLIIIFDGPGACAQILYDRATAYGIRWYT